LARRERLVLELVPDVLVLEPAQALVTVGDLVEGLQQLGLELGLDRGERERVLQIVVVEIAFVGRRLGALAFLAVGALARASCTRPAVGSTRVRWWLVIEDPIPSPRITTTSANQQSTARRL
jgi:hypothetical protein